MIRAAARKKTLDLLRLLSDNRCTVIENDTPVLTADNGEAACIYVNDPRFYTAAPGGSVAVARAYINGWWHTPDLYALMQLAATNIETVNNHLDRSWRRLPQLLSALYGALRRRFLNRRSAQSDIAAHYDISNDFFALFLDDTLSYSCTIFPSLASADSSTLDAAARNKLNIICDKLELTPTDTLLDLGCGWGSLMLHATESRGVAATGITLSAAQHRFLSRQPAIKDKQAAAILCDYRDFQPANKFNKISSVEMIEAASEKHFQVYFQRIRSLLAENGLAQVQAILIPDERYHAARHDEDFIQQYIFPGGRLPSQSIIRQAARNAGLELLNTQDITAHYAPTLLAWRQRFNQQLDAIKAIGFSDRFCRIWEYYFCYCAGAFATGALNVQQIMFTTSRQ